MSDLWLTEVQGEWEKGFSHARNWVMLPGSRAASLSFLIWALTFPPLLP